MGKKLLILGNGFDLQIGLETSFKNFYEKNERKSVEKYLYGNNEEIDSIDLISLLLYNTYYREEDGGLRYLFPEVNTTNYKEIFKRNFNFPKIIDGWVDLETFLYLILTSKNDVLIRCFNYAFECCEGNVNDVLINKDFFCKNDSIALFIKRCLERRYNNNIKNFYDYFLQELKSFEDKFKRYVHNEITTNYDYDKRSQNILRSIAKNSSGIILNFNYTRLKNVENYKVINIHGHIDKEIIIGIDNDKNVENDAILFTKTFRKMVNIDNSVVLGNIFDEIVIYGHSLGKQDYSYYQSIFDYIDLYNGKTKIRFIYSDNFIEDEKDNSISKKNQHKINMIKNLFDLINIYGSTLNNKDNGHNLIHRLILENRLKIELKNFY